MRVLGKLSGEKVRTLPDWEMPKNGTEMQKHEWRMHMREWTFDRLAEKQVADAKRANDPEATNIKRPTLDWSAADDAAIEAARHGSITPALRALYLRLGKFFEKPKGRRGEYPRRKDMLSVAARWAVRCLREEIWPTHFNGKKRIDGLTAEEIAAEWLLGENPGWQPGETHGWEPADTNEIKWKAPGAHKPRRAK